MHDLKAMREKWDPWLTDASSEVEALCEKGHLGTVDDIAAMDLPNKLSEQFAMYARLTSIASSVYCLKTSAKNVLAAHTAELFIGYKNGEEKMTETLIKSRIEQSEGLFEFKQFIGDVDTCELKVTGALESFRQRHFILKSLTDIYTSSVIGAENG